ncbi:MAG: hypothetical protein GX623_07340 [Clostridiales bacterium]|nr:hypothetical protein [Clostridiales bacterium]
MMRKWALLFLAFLLAFAALPVLAQEEARQETVRQLNALVEEYLDAKEYIYDFEDDVFTLDFEMESSLASCTVKVYVYYDMVSVTAIPVMRVPEANRDALAKFIALANNEVFYSYFRMDYGNGWFGTRSAQLVESVLPGMEELDVLFHMPLNDLEDFGDAIAQVALAGADPQEAFIAAMAKLEE